MTLMIVDDENIVRQGIRFSLEHALSEEVTIVAEAKNGREAIELADQYRPNIILMDIQMPGLNGLQTIERIQESYKEVKCILISAFEQFEYAKEALRFGITEYISKPIEDDKLFKVLRKTIAEIRQEQDAKQKSKNFQEQLEEIQPIIECNIIYSLLLHKDPTQLAPMATKRLNPKHMDGYVMVIDFLPAKEDAHVITPSETTNQTIRNIIKYKCHAIVSPLIENRVIVVVQEPKQQSTLTKRNPHHNQNQSFQQEKSLELAGHLYESLVHMLSIPIHIGIGSVQPAKLLSLSLDEALFTIEHMGATTILHSKDVSCSEVDTKISQGVGYIQEHFTKNISLAEVAELVGISPYYFSKLFKEQLGVTFIDFLTQCRIEEAKKLLAKQNESIKQIAYQVGYQDPNYFSRMFKKVEGISPKEYHHE